MAGSLLVPMVESLFSSVESHKAMCLVVCLLLAGTGVADYFRSNPR